MAVQQAPPPEWFFLNASGAPASGWHLFTYAAGTTNKLATFTDSTGVTPNSNPIVLDSRGQPSAAGLPVSVWLTSGTAYKFVLDSGTSDPPTNIVWTVDSVIGVATANINFAAISDALAGTSTTLVMNPLDTANAVQQGFGAVADTGVANAYVGTFTPAVAGRVIGETLQLRIANSSTGALATVNAGLGIDAWKKQTPVGLKPIMAGELVTPGLQPFSWSPTDNSWLSGDSLPRPTWSLPLAKTGGYTIVAADRNRVINFSGLAADATVTFPTSANSEAFEVTITNSDAGINPARACVLTPPSGTLDGFATRKLYRGGRVTVCGDGINWFTKSGKYNFISAQQTITAAGGLTLAHGLGVIPLRSLNILLVNTTGEGNYVAGDITPYFSSTPPANQGVAVVPDATNLNIRYGSTANTFTIPNKNTGAALNITNANWNAVFLAEE